MRIVTLSPPDDVRTLNWGRVVSVRFESDGRNPKAVLVYTHGGRKLIDLSQAIKLWQEVEDHRDCEAPCFYRWEIDEAPDDPACTACQLAQICKGAGWELRPDPVRLPRVDVSMQGCAIFVLGALVLLLIAAKTAPESPTLPKESARASATGAR